MLFFSFSSRRRHTRCALVTGVQTCALPISRTIEDSLQGRYVRNPQVTVNIKSSVSQVVTVDGEVKEPGLYPVTNQMTLMRVIASAKGLSEFAKQEQVVILRTVDNQRKIGRAHV